MNPSQTGYVKGRFIGESIRLILDIMEYTRHKDIPGVAVFLDFEEAFDSVYKIIHNILCTKSLLFKMKKECCPFCQADHTIIHLFTECAQATLF